MVSRWAMATNPEDAVLADIKALEDQAIAAGPTDDYSAPYKARCPHCEGDWHGMPVVGDPTHQRQRGCPGAYATGEQVVEFGAWLDRWATASPSERIAAMAKPSHVVFTRKPHGDNVRFTLEVRFESMPGISRVDITTTWQVLEDLEAGQPFGTHMLRFLDAPHTGWAAALQGCAAPTLAVCLRRRGERTLGPWIARGGDDDPPWQRH